MANQQQVDLLKQEVATTWNMWRAEHPDTAIKLNGVDLRRPTWVKSISPGPTSVGPI